MYCHRRSIELNLAFEIEEREVETKLCEILCFETGFLKPLVANALVELGEFQITLDIHQCHHIQVPNQSLIQACHYLEF